MLFFNESAQPAQNTRESLSQDELKQIASVAAAVLQPHRQSRYRSRVQSFDFGPSGLEIVLAIGLFPMFLLLPVSIIFFGG